MILLDPATCMTTEIYDSVYDAEKTKKKISIREEKRWDKISVYGLQEEKIDFP